MAINRTRYRSTLINAADHNRLASHLRQDKFICLSHNSLKVIPYYK